MCSRLGVYRWRDVLELAKGAPDAKIMAFRFSGTELLQRPVGRSEFLHILYTERGKEPQLTTALRLSPREFGQTYARATGMDGTHE